MAEKLQTIGREKLSSRYWDGHSPADECEWEQKPTHLIGPSYDNELRPFAKKTMIDFLCENQGEPKPISTLKPGQTFDGTKLPKGTIIGYSYEELKMNYEDVKMSYGTTRIASWGNPYAKPNLWGVVCNRTSDDGEIEKVIIPFMFSSLHGELLPSPTENPTLTVGQTRHRRVKGRSGHLLESLVKITYLEVCKIP